MTDDIVTRLREAVCWCNDFDGRCHTCEAADEIERLRADREKWENVAHLAMQAHLDDCWSHVYEAYEVARGGAW